MGRHDLSRAQMADVIRTPQRTLNNWLDDGRKPPACMSPLMDLLEASREVRIFLSVEDQPKPAPRGRPFERGNPWRFARGQTSD